MKIIPYLLIGISIFVFNQSSFSADSSQVVPLGSPKSYHIDVESTPPDVSKIRFDQLSPCPSVIYNCPDINDKGGSLTTCPNYCKQTRIPESPVPVSGTNKFVGTVTEAVCPHGYSSIGSFNMENEIEYDSTPDPVKPVIGMAAYNTYKAAGYTCSTYGSVKESTAYCVGTYIDGAIVDTVNTAGGKVTQIQNSYRSSCYWGAETSDCSITVTKDCNVKPNNPRWVYRYWEIQCTPPAGYYITGNKVPVSLVCARMKSQWRPLQQQ